MLGFYRNNDDTIRAYNITKLKLTRSTDGELLRQWLSGSASITYERHSCSGDTIDGLNSQIGKWSNMGTATVGTLTSMYISTLTISGDHGSKTCLSIDFSGADALI